MVRSNKIDIASASRLLVKGKSWGTGDSSMGDMNVSEDGHLWNMLQLNLDEIDNAWKAGGYSHDFYKGFNLDKAEFEASFNDRTRMTAPILYTGFYKFKSRFRSKWIGFQKFILGGPECHIGWFWAENMEAVKRRIEQTLNGQVLPHNSGMEAANAAFA